MIVIHKMKFLFVILLAPFFLNAQVDNRDVKKVIISYNQGIIKAAKTSKTEHMKSYAKEDIVKKFHLWIKSWHDNNLFMDAKIKDINFQKVEIKDSKAKVTTNEVWIYRYIDIKTRKQVLDATLMIYNMNYILSKENDKWIIEKIDVIFEKKEKFK